MISPFSHYEPRSEEFTKLNVGDGTISAEDELFVAKLLLSFVNKQSALFQRWLKVRVSEHKNNRYNDYKRRNKHNQTSKHPTRQLLVLTPLKIITLPSIEQPKRMKQFRIIDIVSLFVEENTSSTTYDSHHQHQQQHHHSDRASSTSSMQKSKKILNKPRKQYNIDINDTHLKSPRKMRKYNMSPRTHSTSPRSQPIKQQQQKPINHKLRILQNKDDKKIRTHHASASSSSQSHSLSPQPSTSFEQINQNGIAATIHTDDDYEDVFDEEPFTRERRKANTFCYDDREYSKSHSKSISRSKSKTASRSYHTHGANWMSSHNWIYHCCIQFHRLDVLDLSYEKLSSHHMNSEYLDLDIIDIYFENADTAKEFLDVLQFYLFTLHRGVPLEYKPKIEIIPHQLSDNDICQYNGNKPSSQYKQTKYPFVPSQVFIDRYVAYCDAQQIPALESVIDYVIHTNNDDMFDVGAAFSHHYYGRNGTQHASYSTKKRNPLHVHPGHHQSAFSEEHSFNTLQIRSSMTSNDSYAPHASKQIKNINQQQYVALGHALAFLKMYKKLCIDRLNTDDANIATLMKIYETNPYITACEFRKCAIKKITMQSLSISLRAGIANLKELSIVDINLTKTVLKDLDLDNCNLTKLVLSKCNMPAKAVVYLFTTLMKTGQYKSMQHLNISYNHCDKDGTKRLSTFLRQSLGIQKLIVNDARCDGDILFNGLHLNSYNNLGNKHHLENLSYLDFSGNILGDVGARKLSNFIQSSCSLRCLKLSRCNMTQAQLHKIFEGALANNSGLTNIDSINDMAVDEDDDLSLDLNEEEVDEVKQMDDMDAMYLSDNALHDHPIVEYVDEIQNKLTRSRSAGVESAAAKALPTSDTLISGKNAKNKYKLNLSHSHYETRNVLLSYLPTRCDIIQCQQLVRMTLDLSYNNLGSKGADTICELLRNRLLKGNIGNYTIVSLCLSGNVFDVEHLSNILRYLHCCICLESLDISDNIKQTKYFNMKSAKEDTVSKEQQIGGCLVELCRRATNLERLMFKNNDLSIGMEPFLSSLAYLSNLKYIDLSNNKFGDKQIKLLTDALSYNRTFIRALKISQNKMSHNVLIEYMQLLASHQSLIDVSTCLPHEQIAKYSKMKKYNATFTRLENEASLNLRGNKFQYDIDKKMVSSLSWRERAEKELRLQCGQQYAIPLESVRGTVKFTEYHARIPRILVNLRNYLKAKGGFEKPEIFRFSADAKKFELFKRDLNANAQNVKTDDTHSIANAIKAFYHDLPIKVLNNVNIALLRSVKAPSDVQNVIHVIAEPYKSLFEWLLDLCVDIVTNQSINKMNPRSMAVVLCPSLYNAYAPSPIVNISKIVRVVMEFTDFAIQWRIEYRSQKGEAKYQEEWIEDPNDVRNMKSPRSNRVGGNRQRKMDFKNNDYFEDQVPWKETLQKWDKMIIDLNEWEIEQQAWNECNLYSNREEEKTRVCYCMDRLTFIMQYYKEWLIKKNINPLRQSVVNVTILEEITRYQHPMREFIDSLSHYNNVALLNDFHHMLRYHSANEELEDMMVNLEKAMSGNGCCIVGTQTQCTCLIRNNRNRDRDKNRPRKMKIYYGYKRSAEICTQQLLDKIHCYLFHTFDTLRFTKYERTQIAKAAKTKDERECQLYHRFLQPKSEKLGQIRGNHRVRGTKFSSNISDLIQRINNNPMLYEEEDEDDDNDGEHDIYTLGQPFDYTANDVEEQTPAPQLPQSPSSSNAPQSPLPQPQQWLVKKKYKNFKEEMLHNNLRYICCDSWNDSYFKALIIQKTTIAKKIGRVSSNKHIAAQTPPPMALVVDVDGSNSLFDDLYADIYEIIPIQHLMAVLLYCDFDNLRFSFHKTFYPQSIDESVMNWKLRNAEYHHWSAYLKQAVATCDGIDLNLKHNQDTRLTLYHSSSNEAFLTPKYISFCYPISFNQHLSIVDTFSPKNGIIFAFEYQHISVGNQFNCCWISDYANYDEQIIFSNNSPDGNYLKISNILDVVQCTNYKSFWDAIQMLYCLINASYNASMYNHKDITRCLSLLLDSQIQHKKSNAIPHYIHSLFCAFCSDYVLGQITLNPTQFDSTPKIQKYLFDEYKWCKLEVFCCSLFVNVTSIKIMNMKLTKHIFDNLYAFLAKFCYFQSNSVSSKRRGAIADDRLKHAPNVPLSLSSSASVLSLKSIQFIRVNEDSSSLKCKQCVATYYMKFNHIGWNMRDVESCLYFEKID